MAWRWISAVVTACCLAAAEGAVAEETSAPPVQYLPLDAPPGMSRAVIVRDAPLVYTRQLLPLDRQGKLVGEDSADAQIEQVLDNLEAVLQGAGSGLDKLVRLNVCALSHEAAGRVRQRLAKRLDPAVRPALTTVLTPLPHRKALVAVDAIAVGAGKGPAAALQRVEAVSGDPQCADAATVRGGVAYLSGQPEKGALAESAVARSLSALLRTLRQLKLGPAQVVQVKVFLAPASSAEEALGEVRRFFPGQLTPPVVFVEWIASAPVEIELVAQLPPADAPAPSVAFYDPPEVKPSPTFSRAALVRAERQIFISGLSARAPGSGEAQARDVFEQLTSILAETGGDLRHLAKATYYVSDDEASKAFDKLRPVVFASQQPPAASKVTVHGVGQPERTLSMDMIAVGADR